MDVVRGQVPRQNEHIPHRLQSISAQAHGLVSVILIHATRNYMCALRFKNNLDKNVFIYI